MKTKIISLIALLFLVGCSAVKLLPSTQSDVERGKATYPDLTMAQLEEGKALFQEKCTMCHGLKNPRKKDAAGWNKTVPIMVKRANKTEVRIDPKQQELITKYLVTMCNAPKAA